MQFVLPVAGAAAGFVIGGPTGMSVGWLVGSWLGSAFMKQKNEVFDSGAQEMPLFNQALRGATMPVTYGTIRVASQIVWQANFTTIRQESAGGGGGKFGGSGGGKMPAGGAQVSYQYKWDMIYHLGIVHSGRSYRLFGGWDGPDKINDSTILAIDPADGEVPLAASELTVQEEQAGISFDEAFFYNGDPTVAGWTHAQTIMGHTIRWPYTAWIGFKQLDLGASPHVPQLTWEIGPGARSISGSPDSLQYDGPFAVTSNRVSCSARADIYGQKYVCLPTSLSDGSNWVFGDDAQYIGNFVIVNDINTYFGTSISDWTGLWGNLDTTGRYYMAMAYETVPSRTFLAVYEVNDGALPTFKGAVWAELGVGVPDVNRETEIRVSGAGRTDLDSILVRYSDSSGGETGWYAFPPIDTIIAGTYNVTGGYGAVHSIAGSWGVGEVPKFKFRADSSTFYEDFYNRGVNPGSSWVTATVAGTTVVNFYFSKNDMDWYAANPASSFTNPYTRDTLQPAYPNGCAIGVDIGNCLWTVLSVVSGKGRTYTFDHTTAVTVHQFTDKNGDTFYSFSGETDDIDGGAATNSFSRQVYFEWLDDTYLNALVIFYKGFDDDVSQQPGNGANGYVYGRIKACIFNTFLGTYTEFADKTMLMFRTAEIGVSDLDNAINSDHSISFWRNENNLTVIYNFDGTSDVDWENTCAYVYGTEINVTGGEDLTPPEIIYDILTNTVYGRGYPESLIDSTSYTAAVDYCEDNDIRVSTQWRREGDFLDIIEMCLEIYGGYITKSNGIIHFGLIDDGTVGGPTSDYTIDNSHFVIEQKGEPPVNVTDTAHQDTFNKVRVNYLDRSIEYKQNQVEVSDEVDQDLYGIRMREFPLQFVMQEKTAERMAVRALWSNLYPRKVYSFKLGFKDHHIEPGDVVTLVDSFTSTINALARITYKKEIRKGVWETKAVQEFTNLATLVGSNTSVTSASSNVVPKPLQAASYSVMYELPYEFQDTDNGALYAGYVPSVFTAGARIYVSADGVTYAVAQEATPYPLGGTLLSPLPYLDAPRFMEHVRVALFPSSGWSANSPTYSIEATLNEVEESARGSGASLIWVGSEMIAYEGVTLLGQNYYEFDRVYRGWGGTAISAHNSGDYFHKHGAGIFSQNFTEDKIGQLIYYKIVPVNLVGLEYNVASVTAQTYTIRGGHYAAQNAGILTFANSGRVSGNKKLYVGSTVDIRIDWDDASRKSGYGAGGFGLGGFGDFSTDPMSHNWYVHVVGSAGTVVYSTTVYTPSFTYPQSQNVADNGAWRGNVAIKVTPFSPYATAPRTSVISMELFS